MKPQTLAAYITALSLVPSVATAQDKPTGSIELMIGQDSATVDTISSVPILPKLSFFNRNRFTSGYTAEAGKLNTLHIFSFNSNIVNSLDLVGETDLIMPVGIAEPRVGLQYFGDFGELKMFNYATVSCRDGNFLAATNLSYEPDFTDLLTVNLEAFTDVGREGHNFSGQRLRVGPKIGEYKLGFAADLSENGPKGDFSYNLGLFAKRKF